jgi:hypothetical protein
MGQADSQPNIRQETGHFNIRQITAGWESLFQYEMSLKEVRVSSMK